jgi:hypothetical protein
MSLTVRLYGLQVGYRSDQGSGVLTNTLIKPLDKGLIDVYGIYYRGGEALTFVVIRLN